MPATGAAHPGSQVLQAYGLGQLDASRLQEVEEHVGGCIDCLALLDEYPSDPFVSALRSAYAIPPADVQAQPLAETSAPFLDNAGTESDPPEVPPELEGHARYRVSRLIGRGGMGAVYEAEHTLMERTVALKVISPRLLEHAGALARFGQEVKTAARLQHPNIVTAFDAEQVGSLTVLVMEYVAGRSLAEHLDEAGPLPIEQACDYVRQAALGLQCAHDQGMVHRDIKPHNLMLTPGGRVKILDFGLARFVSEGLNESPPETAGEAVLVAGTPAPEPGLTSSGACMGTLDYVAPEQACDARQADARADLYSLGCTLYQLLTGRVPFPGGGGAEKLARLHGESPTSLTELRPEVPAELVAVVTRLMAKRPEDRFASSAEVAAALAPFTPQPPEAGRAPQLRWQNLVGLAALLLAGVLLTVAVVKMSSDGEDKRIDPDESARLDPRPSDPVGPAEIREVGERVGTGGTVLVREWKSSLAGPACGAAFLDGGRRVVAGFGKPDGGRRVVYVWETEGGQEVLRFEPPGPGFERLVPTPDGGSLLLLSTDGLQAGLHVRALAGGEDPRSFGNEETARYRDAAFLPGSRLVTGGEDGILRLWNVNEGRLLHSFRRVAGPIARVAVSPDGRRALASEFGSAWLWDLESFKPLANFPIYVGPAGMPFSPDGQRLLLASPSSYELRLVDAVSRREIARLQGHTDRVAAAVFTPDSRFVLTGSSGGWVGNALRPGEDRTVRLWEAGTGRELEQWEGNTGGVLFVDVAPDGRHVVVAGGDGTVRLFRLSPPTPTSLLPPRLTDVRELTELWQTKDQRSPRALAVSPDGKWAYSSGYDNTARQWNLSTRQEARRFGDGMEPFDSLALSPDGKRLLLAHHKFVARLWDVESAKELQAFKGHVNTISAVALSPDAKRALTGAHDHTVRLWDIETGKEQKTLTGHAGPVRAVAFLSDNRVVSGSHDRTVRVWNLDTGETTVRFGPFDNYVLSLAVAPGSKRMVVNAGSSAALLDRGSGLVSRWFNGHTDKLHAVAISPDGRLLATGGYDKTVRVWELDTGQCLAVGRGHTDYIVSVAFVGNSQVLSAGDHTIRLWELPGAVGPPRP